ncbi:N-acetyl-gamma-glutamyl-phosphate reductase [Zhaonella formicivorans]|uniref:N-acetyl-gamma-glutamyl-phosphate reductase n=1 Tax=Zhaonella formicivorans TaxID=2528593 RepID=UPI0010E9C036|nr:N-acetyl-gamma-glutamyl-phosphate reductase [Zhaonella formicivorans]
MIKASIIGATGYTGVELVRLLAGHREVELVALTSQSYEAEDYTAVYPNMTGYINKKCTAQDVPEIIGASDVVFIALPHGHAVPVAAEAVKQGKKVIDLGADFRFDDLKVYEEWYKVEHTGGSLLSRAVYGLPEINRERIKNAAIVGNPGCYPTSIILGLAPALKHGLVVPDTIIIDSKSGVSGAGRKLALGSHYAEVNENINAYGVASHRHTPEIEQELSKLAGTKLTVSFTPHLMPMTRGILSTIYATVKDNIALDEVREVYSKYYTEEPFVHLLPPGQWPHTKWVYGSNNCQLNLTIDRRTNRLIICSVIDNLVKGAAGQAVQNMNILFGLPETTALRIPGMYP